MQEIAAFFSTTGALSKAIGNYQPRQAQVEMARAVARVIAEGGILVAEAGTGTGKTFAYLVPALLSGQQIIVSTGSRNLQDQLFLKDLPLLRKALGRPFQLAQLKGRSNYMCHYRMQQTLEADLLRDDQDRADLAKVRQWMAMTRVGDIAEFDGLPEHWWGWGAVTSTEDSCLGQNCPFISDCFLLKARQRAHKADLLVINHHLLCADWALREDGLGELLPRTQAVIVDEAHQFAETATRFLGDNMTSRQLQELIRDCAVEQQQAGMVTPAATQALQELHLALNQVQNQLGQVPRRGVGADLEGVFTLATLQESLTRTVEALAPLAGASEGLEVCFQRAQTLKERLATWLAGDKPDWVRWFEVGKRSFALHATPLEVSASFAGYRKASEAAWIFTSATLSVAGKFDHFLNQLGLAEPSVKAKVWESPFDYANQALLYLPPGLPDPSASHYTARVVAAARPVLEASGGRAFFLFTSHRALQEAAALLSDSLPFPLLIQGSAPKAVLLDRFRKLGNAVLMGTASFWEGVDVRGSALSCVIIDKLPFAALGDPVFQARLASLRRRGHNPFLEYQLPSAVIALKQGAGRLIRGMEDRGVLMLCDPRLMNKSYGRVFLASLPPMQRCRELEQVRKFFNNPCFPK
ncbi:MAG: helicase [Methylothermaceae bacteria B42]|nr:MAG: helicase [Methylothermaceae bacteria B42]HHJ38639.1 ATP-dependent DNA helicase [Methylothermaceae bacterium]